MKTLEFLLECLAVLLFVASLPIGVVRLALGHVP